MYARVATESDPSDVDDAIEMVRTQVESGETPAGLEGAKMLMLVNRETGKRLGGHPLPDHSGDRLVRESARSPQPLLGGEGFRKGGGDDRLKRVCEHLFVDFAGLRLHAVPASPRSRERPQKPLRCI